MRVGCRTRVVSRLLPGRPIIQLLEIELSPLEDRECDGEHEVPGVIGLATIAHRSMLWFDRRFPCWG